MIRDIDKYSLARIPGQHVPTFVLRALKALYPTVKLVWNYEYQCWQMIEKMDNGKWGEVMLMRDGQGRAFSPNIQNTVGLLQELDRARMLTKWDLDRFLAGLDAEREKAIEAKRKKTREIVRPAGEALWDAMNGKIMVPFGGRRKPWQRRSRLR